MIVRVRAVLYTHSHIDHFAGVRGVVDEADVRGRVQIVAPEGVLHAAVSENVIAGNVMTRRARRMYGTLLPPAVRVATSTPGSAGRSAAQTAA